MVDTLCISGFVLLAVILYFTNKRKIQLADKVVGLDVSGGTSGLLQEVPKPPAVNCLFLFGEFTVIDNCGRDISHLFSPLLKQFMALILIYSVSEQKGISSTAISRKIWPGKDIRDTKNNKGVHLSKLRKLVQSIDGLELIYAKNLYTFCFSEHFYCDYAEWSNTKGLSEPSGSHFSARGPFLQYMCAEWIDCVKAETESILISNMEASILRSYTDGLYQQTIDCCTALFNIDEFNDVALKYLTSCLYQLNKPREASKAYASFALNYLQTFGEEYPEKLPEVVGRRY